MVRYPWDKWLSRKRKFKLLRGVDFFCQPHSMGMQIRNAATIRGLRAKVHILEDLLEVEVIDAT